MTARKLPLVLMLLLVPVNGWACICKDDKGIRIVCPGPDDWHRSDEDGIVQPQETPFYKKDRQKKGHWKHIGPAPVTLECNEQSCGHYEWVEE